MYNTHKHTIEHNTHKKNTSKCIKKKVYGYSDWKLIFDGKLSFPLRINFHQKIIAFQTKCTTTIQANISHTQHTQIHHRTQHTHTRTTHAKRKLTYVLAEN